MSGRLRRFASIVLASVTLAALPAIATPATPIDGQRIVPRLPVKPVVRETPLALSAIAHSAFGKIASFGPPGFVLRLRSGRLLVVDDSAAVASGRMSMPLFLGKLVVVSGALGPRGTFVAQTVTRMERIDTQTRPDR
jgi:hypothetical protein